MNDQISPARPIETVQGVFTVPLNIIEDERGRFMETFRREWLPAMNWDRIQTNRSDSRAGVLRGLHYHFHQIDYWVVVSGSIRVGLADLRRQIALVGQKVMLFDDTVAANIALGAEGEPSMAQIRAAAEAANALEFIERLPQGFETRIGENGALLSGGQRQRLAIARAFLKDAPILILDEATAALDPESERLIQAALAKLIPDRTTLVIAHRLSTVEHADQVLVLDQGSLVEAGTHAELLARDGLYARLHSLQFQDSPG